MFSLIGYSLHLLDSHTVPLNPLLGPLPYTCYRIIHIQAQMLTKRLIFGLGESCVGQDSLGLVQEVPGSQERKDST